MKAGGGACDSVSSSLALRRNAGIIPHAMKVLGVLGSGKGSNFTALFRAVEGGRLAARFGLVASDHPGAGILSTARAAGLPTWDIAEPRYRTRLSEDTERALATRLREAGCELLVLAGYMRVVKEPLLSAFPRAIINIHPSLLPKFPGLEAWRQALDAGETEAGCTVHWVDAGVDTGEIIAQERVPVLPGDTPELLHARIQAAEHRLLPEVLATLCLGEA